MEILLGILIGLLIGVPVTIYILSNYYKKNLKSGKEDVDRLIAQAQKEADNIIRQAELDAKEKIIKAESDFEKEYKSQKAELQKAQERLNKKEENIEKKNEFITSKELEVSDKEHKLNQKDKYLNSREKDLEQKIVEQEKKLEKIAGMSPEEAKEQLKQKYVFEVKQQISKEIKQLEENAKEEAEKKAKWIIGTAVQRYSGEHIQEISVTTVNLPNDEMKGRIIGREGRNIRSLEAACGVDLIIDDTPEVVVISGFDPIRREIARISLEKLIADGRIHPTRIEEIVEKAQSEVEKSIKEAGEGAILELGVGRVNPELVKLIGKLKYRYSYAQNVLRHSIEASYIAGMIAGELGWNIKQAKRAALLHDIGKAVSHEVEGSHATIGANLAKKHGETDLIVNAIAAHHEDEPPQSVLAFIVAASDALSGARPGARREMVESYVKRLENLEKICTSFAGVDKSYALQAGREVRVLVENSKVNDDEAKELSRQIARKIEEELAYPGQIKVTVIRETRAVEYAK